MQAGESFSVVYLCAEDTTWHDRTEGVLCIYLSSWDHVMGPQLVFCWRMEPAIPGEDTHSGDAEDVRSTPHYLKCHQFLENPEAFLVRKEAPQQVSGRVHLLTARLCAKTRYKNTHFSVMRLHSCKRRNRQQK